MSPPKIDLVIFGATGFTGQVAVLQILKLVKEKNLTWGVAGRTASKLKEVLLKASSKSGENLDNIPVIIADVNDEKSLNELANQAKVVVNCVGPYRFYGEAVVKACIANGAHHVDVSGEPQFMERMQLEYHKAAEEKGVYIISACGFDSIPADMGLVHYINEFKGEVNSVETYLEAENTGKVEGAAIHYGTWESAVYGILYQNEMRPLREKLFPERLPKFSPRLNPRGTVHKSPVIGKWCLPFLGSDRPVMYRSQRFLYEQDHTRPVQVQSYVAFSGLLQTIVLIIMGAIFAVMTKTSFTRNLLLKHPKLFSAGFVSHEGPTEQTMANTLFSFTFYGEGWKERKPLEEGHASPPDKTMITKVSGRDPGYGFTTIALLLSAITILQENDKMPGKGGVLPPGAAFAKTSLIKELSNHGLKFEIIKGDIKSDAGKTD